MVERDLMNSSAVIPFGALSFSHRALQVSQTRCFPQASMVPESALLFYI